MHEEARRGLWDHELVGEFFNMLVRGGGWPEAAVLTSRSEFTFPNSGLKPYNNVAFSVATV